MASMAYSTWKRRPSGEKVLTPRSYSARFWNMTINYRARLERSEYPYFSVNNNKLHFEVCIVSFIYYKKIAKLALCIEESKSAGTIPLLGVAGHNFYFVGRDSFFFKFESAIFYNKSPDIITKSVGM